MGLSAGIGEVVRGARDGSGDGSTPYDPIGGGDGAATVMIRIRPINKVESALHGYNRCLIQESSQTLTWTGHPETRFTFDHVACEDTTQEKLF
ncbi:kinesin-like protein KIN-12E isoform X3 [Ananas comosus]|uniref:Kinesin-like protein KIN-12E isoform X3 n=1 Tax=Ananas comosus TaxID=4615 RepID=A0A6P5EF32_ANACO|nr:kinesin-like protein KIN-12E isoform X3 [Ananas comosus]